MGEGGGGRVALRFGRDSNIGTSLRKREYLPSHHPCSCQDHLNHFPSVPSRFLLVIPSVYNATEKHGIKKQLQTLESLVLSLYQLKYAVIIIRVPVRHDKPCFVTIFF